MLKAPVLAGGTAVVLIAAIPVLAVDTPPTWNAPETVASVPAYFPNLDLYAGQDRYLAYDHFGNAGIAFVDEITTGGTRFQPFYARRAPGLGWVVDDRLSFGFFPTLASQPCLAFNHLEQPACTSMSTPTDDNDTHLFLSIYDDESAVTWNNQDLSGFGNGFGQLPRAWLTSSLRFDVLGRAHVIGTNFDVFTASETLRYKFDSDGDGDLNPETWWYVLDLDPFPYEDMSVTLAVDSIARPMAAIWLEDTDINSSEVLFAMKDTGLSWQNVQLATNASHPSIAIDPDNDFPAVAYHDVQNANLVYAWWDGNQWVHDVVASTGITGLWPSLAFDPADGNPSIAYHNQSTGSLMHAWHDGAQWNTQVAVAGSFEVPTGFTPSIAFNDFGTGFPAIAYFDISSELRFVEDPPLPGDLNGDGVIGVPDLLVMLGDWGLASSPADLNDDATVDVLDLLLLLANWG